MYCIVNGCRIVSALIKKMGFYIEYVAPDVTALWVAGAPQFIARDTLLVDRLKQLKSGTI